MLEDANYFGAKKSLAGQAIDLLVMIYDVISTVVLGFPLVLISFYQQFVQTKKEIRGKLAMVNKFRN